MLQIFFLIMLHRLSFCLDLSHSVRSPVLKRYQKQRTFSPHAAASFRRTEARYEPSPQNLGRSSNFLAGVTSALLEPSRPAKIRNSAGGRPIDRLRTSCHAADADSPQPSANLAGGRSDDEHCVLYAAGRNELYADAKQ